MDVTLGSDLHKRTTFNVVNAHQRSIVIVPIVMVAVATICVAMRFRARYLMKNKFMLDDWMALLALFLTWVFQGVNMAAVYAGGAGLPLKTVLEIDPNAMVVYLRIQVANFTIWLAAVTVVQLSIVFFYIRIFGVYNLFKWLSWILVFGITAFGIAGILVELFSCNPVQKLWIPATPGTCLDTYATCGAVGTIHVIFDLFIVALPLPLIWKIQTSFRNRMILTGLLAIGLVATILSLLKIVCFFNLTGIPPEDFTDWIWLTILLQTIELPIGIICCCAPSLRPVLKEMTQVTASVARGLLSMTGSNRSRTGLGSRLGDSGVQPDDRSDASARNFMRLEGSGAGSGAGSLKGGYSHSVRADDIELKQQNRKVGNGDRGIQVVKSYNVE